MFEDEDVDVDSVGRGPIICSNGALTPDRRRMRGRAIARCTSVLDMTHLKLNQKFELCRGYLQELNVSWTVTVRVKGTRNHIVPIFKLGEVTGCGRFGDGELSLIVRMGDGLIGTFHKRRTIVAITYFPPHITAMEISIAVVRSARTVLPTGTPTKSTDSRQSSELNSPNDDLAKLLDQGTLSDVVLRVQDGTTTGRKDLRAHKAVLAARSPVLRQTLKSNMAESVLEVDFPASVMEQVLRYMYTGCLEFATEAPEANSRQGGAATPRALLAAADFYQLTVLKRLCEEHLLQGLCVAEVLETLVLARRCSASTLDAAALDFAVEHMKDLRQRHEWSDFRRMHPDLADQLMGALVEKYQGPHEADLICSGSGDGPPPASLGTLIARFSVNMQAVVGLQPGGKVTLSKIQVAPDVRCTVEVVRDAIAYKAVVRIVDMRGTDSLQVGIRARLDSGVERLVTGPQFLVGELTNFLSGSLQRQLHIVVYQHDQLSRDLANLLDTGLLSDFDLQLLDAGTADSETPEEGPTTKKAKKALSAHKAVLVARIPFFQGLFNSANETAEARSSTVTVNFPASVMKNILRYAYTGRVNFDDVTQDGCKVEATDDGSADNPMALLAAADYYQLLSLKNLCAERLVQRKISHTKLLETLVFADRYNSPKLKKVAVASAVAKLDKLRKQPDWGNFLRDHPNIVDDMMAVVSTLLAGKEETGGKTASP